MSENNIFSTVFRACFLCLTLVKVCPVSTGVTLSPVDYFEILKLVEVRGDVILQTQHFALSSSSMSSSEFVTVSLTTFLEVFSPLVDGFCDLVEGLDAPMVCLTCS